MCKNRHLLTKCFPQYTQNTTKENIFISNIKLQGLEKIVHPKSIKINEEADNYVFEWVFGGKNLRFFRRSYLFIKKILGLIFKKQ